MKMQMIHKGQKTQRMIKIHGRFTHLLNPLHHLKPLNLLNNPRGISVLFLVVAMLLMVAIGYVFSYLIPTKQKSVIFSIHSNQAYFLAQSGVEFAVRYASANGLSSLSTPITKNLGSGSFTITYIPAPTDRLTSDGIVPNTSQRRIVISNFSTLLSKLILAPGYGDPCWCLGTRRARFFIQNAGSTNITLNAFSATWIQVGQPRTIRRIDMGISPPLTQKYAGSYSNGSSPVNFNQGGNTQLILPNQVIEVVVYWSGNTNGRSILINFFSPGGDVYTFNLDPEGDGLGSCPLPC